MHALILKGMARATRVAIALAAVIGFCAAPVAARKPDGGKVERHAIEIEARTITAFSRLGGSVPGDHLRFRGGLVLTSRDPAFGGFSGLELSDDGKRLLAVSDAGVWISADIVYREGRLAGLTHATIEPLRALSSGTLSRGWDRDAEGLRLENGNFDNGLILIAFELNQRIGFFPLRAGAIRPPIGYLRPPVRLPKNRSLESVAVIRGGHLNGSILAFAERAPDASGNHQGWVWPARRRQRHDGPAGFGKAWPVALTNVAGFDITDAAASPDGTWIYVLERRFRWTEGINMRIRRVRVSHVQPGAVLQGEILITAGLSHQIDNMEGLAVTRGADGRTILTLISDDNFNSFLQRTMLLQFEVK